MANRTCAGGRHRFFLLHLATLIVVGCYPLDNFRDDRSASHLLILRFEGDGFVMQSRLDGFYFVQWEGLNPGGGAGQGVAFVKGGRVYGGDHLTFFIGEFEDHDVLVTAKVGVFPLQGAYRSVTGVVDDAPWDISDIRGRVPGGALPINVEVQLDAERADSHARISVRFTRILEFPDSATDCVWH